MFQFGDQTFTTESFTELAKFPLLDFSIASAALNEVHKYRTQVDRVANGHEGVYGINTGFGYLSNVRIEKDKLDQLQLNILRSHAAGVGPIVSEKIARGMMILRLHTFLFGNSGVREECIRVVEECLKKDVLPVIPTQGSVGASGDLAPLAHQALLLIGEGDCLYKGKQIPAIDALKKEKISPLTPRAKEGLALINGTHFMAVRAAFLVSEAQNIAKCADIIAAISLDGVRGSVTPFDPRIHKLRPQPFQAEVAQNMLNLLGGDDQILASHKDCSLVQDPYSFRCIPQVHGAGRYIIEHAKKVVDIDLNAVTDNPLIFDNGDALSGGNFHGQYLANQIDFLAVALAEFGSISERRIEKLTNPNLSQLPAFAIKDSGLNNGFMISHYVAAALVSENKTYAHPASVDSIPTSADKEDHVSMGPGAMSKCEKIVDNVYNILAIELLTGCQALDLHAPLKPSVPLRSVLKEVRKFSPYMDQDRSISAEIELTAKWLKDGKLVSVINSTNLLLN